MAQDLVLSKLLTLNLRIPVYPYGAAPIIDTSGLNSTQKIMEVWPVPPQMIIRFSYVGRFLSESQRQHTQLKDMTL